MRDLNYQLKQLCDRNRDGSYATQSDRARILSHVANQLHDLGYRHMNADSLCPKHVDAVVQQWRVDGVSAGTMPGIRATIGHARESVILLINVSQPKLSS
ncbi:phage integrase N-terminal domain-containing protein [Duganella sp. BJB475]|uniref:phage integrase N-terminal domain-containing protein n=1 Tax=Duganella sp. BJB475 TaxID=2233914 RepID=UPI001E5F2470|nr:phage integrase N-terminal domain-containing protein [Duganella sp. BJB475]